ncbi:layilin-like [Oreochromis aureus]|uniref:layilin-like n=1 Tax=Oreochromis aureus TaxID=47969 RepID=UPI001953B383|nr:layilin-like [Oreochromis aureus]
MEARIATWTALPSITGWMVASPHLGTGTGMSHRVVMRCALYMFQWNDSNCETKNNFICKYTAEEPLDPSPSPNSTQTDVFPSPVVPWNPNDHNHNQTVLNLVYIIIPTIPLILLLLTVTGVCCFKLIVRREPHATQPWSE